MAIMCVLCDQPTVTIDAIVMTGNAEDPDFGPLCRQCTALAPPKRKALRDEAMARQLRQHQRASVRR